MSILENFLKLLTVYYPAITIISLVIGGFWAAVKYRENIRDKRFTTYHNLIDGLVNEQTQPDRVIKLDRQIAIVYELRNFPRYFDVTIRIFEGLKQEWKHERGLKEIDLSLEYMRTNWFCRFFKNNF